MKKFHCNMQRFFCLYKGCCVCAALFFYCCVFVIIPCDHVKKFPSFYYKGCNAFFAYIRDVAALFSIVVYLVLAVKNFIHA